jgi:DNA-binding NarL/FixJ family response regulator
MSAKIKVAYIEDHRIVKEGVSYLLSRYPGIEVIPNDVDGNNIEDFISKTQPDILILDLQLYGGASNLNGFEICSVVSASHPDVKLIAHTMYDNVESVNKFFSHGGMAFVSKKSGHTELVDAINSVQGNRRYVCSEIKKKAKNVNDFLSSGDTQLKGTNELFTRTEKGILEKIAKGYSTKQIAQQLEISEKTVETHRKHLFDKAGVKNVAELIAFAYINKLFIE